VVGDRVATGREIIVRSVLILIRTSLIALTRSLVVIRPRLILIARRLVAIAHRLVAISRGAVTHLIDRTGREFGTAGRTPRNTRRLAAGWALHNLCHHPLPFPERALSNTDGSRLGGLERREGSIPSASITGQRTPGASLRAKTTFGVAAYSYGRGTWLFSNA
jgi:hypothetical protein